jgi:hypothetical protein
VAAASGGGSLSPGRRLGCSKTTADHFILPFFGLQVAATKELTARQLRAAKIRQAACLSTDSVGKKSDHDYRQPILSANGLISRGVSLRKMPGSDNVTSIYIPLGSKL